MILDRERMVVIVNLPTSNSHSILNAYRQLGIRAKLTTDNKIVLNASHLVLPGVGSFGSAMAFLHSSKLFSVIYERFHDRRPILGVCLGMQLLTKGSEESPEAHGFGFFDATCIKIPSVQVFVPHVGWNIISPKMKNALWPYPQASQAVYFSHSYFVPKSHEFTSATTTHGLEFSSMIQYDNCFGIQFHPERSQKFGLRLLKAFTEI